MRPVVLAILLVLVAAAPAAAAKPTVSATVDAAVAAGQVPADQGAAYKAIYTQARAAQHGMPASSRRELRGATSVLEGLVKRHALPAARMPAAFLQLQRNVEWWPSHGPPSSSASTGGLPRVTFSGDPIVLQWYPGHGLAIQWLATFGKANALAAAGRTGDLRLLLDRAAGLAGRRGNGFLAWEYLVPFEHGQAPWISSISQGTGIQAFTRGAQLLADPGYAEVARQALGAFAAAPPEGVSVAADHGHHYLLYSFAPRMRVLNAFLQSLVGIWDFAHATGDAQAQALYASGDRAARRELHRFDTGAWSLYSQAGSESSLGYHDLVTGFLGSLCDRTHERGYCRLQARFARYRHEAPRLRISFAGRHRTRHTLRVRVWNSKISSVSLRISRGDQALVSRSMTLARGTHTFHVRPAHAGTLTVSVGARDLAGNAGSASRSVAIRPKHRR